MTFFNKYIFFIHSWQQVAEGVLQAVIVMGCYYLPKLMFVSQRRWGKWQSIYQQLRQVCAVAVGCTAVSLFNAFANPYLQYFVVTLWQKQRLFATGSRHLQLVNNLK